MMAHHKDYNHNNSDNDNDVTTDASVQVDTQQQKPKQYEHTNEKNEDIFAGADFYDDSVEALADASNTEQNAANYQCQGQEKNYCDDSSTDATSLSLEDGEVQETDETDVEIRTTSSEKAEICNNNNIRYRNTLSSLFGDEDTRKTTRDSMENTSIGTYTSSTVLNTPTEMPHFDLDTPYYTSAKKQYSIDYAESKRQCRRIDEEFTEIKLVSTHERNFHGYSDNDEGGYTTIGRDVNTTGSTPCSVERGQSAVIPAWMTQQKYEKNCHVKPSINPYATDTSVMIEGGYAAIAYSLDKARAKSSPIRDITKENVQVLRDYHGLGQGQPTIVPVWMPNQQKQPQTTGSPIFPQTSNSIKREISSPSSTRNYHENNFNNDSGSGSTCPVSNENSTSSLSSFCHDYSAVIPSWITQQKCKKEHHVDSSRNKDATDSSDMNEGRYAAIGYSLDTRRANASLSSSSQEHGLGRSRPAMITAWVPRQQKLSQTSISLPQTNISINREKSSSSTTRHYNQAIFNNVSSSAISEKNNTGSVSSFGRGRSAVSPAWMNQQQTPSMNKYATDSLDMSEIGYAAIGYTLDKTIAKPSSSVPADYHGLGRGRTAIAPAWMTHQQKQPQTSLVFAPAAETNNREDPSFSTARNHRQAVPNNTSGGSSIVSDDNTAGSLPSLGRGRSAVLPAWMNQQQIDTRLHVESNMNKHGTDTMEMKEGGYTAIVYSLDETIPNSSSSSTPEIIKENVPVTIQEEPSIDNAPVPAGDYGSSVSSSITSRVKKRKGELAKLLQAKIKFNNALLAKKEALANSLQKQVRETDLLLSRDYPQ